MVKEYACKNCKFTMLFDKTALKDSKLYCPRCNTKFVGIAVNPFKYRRTHTNE